MTRGPNQIEESARKRAIILSAVSEAAETGAPCPSTAELARLSGYSVQTIGEALRRLEDDGHIIRSVRGSWRTITITATGKATAGLPPVAEVPTNRPPVEVGTIITLAAEVFGVSRRELIGPSRPLHIARPRQAVCIVASRIGWGPSHIGRVIKRDHSTVSHARDLADAFERHDPAFAAGLAALESRARALAA